MEKDRFIRIGAKLFLGQLIVALALVFSLSSPILVTPIWWGVCYLGCRQILRAEDRRFANLTSINLGQIIALVDYSIHTNATPVFNIVQMIGLSAGVAWLLLTRSRASAVALGLIHAPFATILLLNLMRMEVWSLTWRVAVTGVLIHVVAFLLSAQLIWTWKQMGAPEDVAVVFE